MGAATSYDLSAGDNGEKNKHLESPINQFFEPLQVLLICTAYLPFRFTSFEVT